MDAVLVNVKRHAITLSIDTFTVYNFDLEGRLVGAFREDRNFRRAQDGRIMEKWGAGGRKVRHRRWLSESETRELVGQVLRDVRDVQALIGSASPSVTFKPDDPPLVMAALSRILEHDYPRLLDEARHFRSIYKSIPILPPDMYMALVLQATEGCSYNRCTFCTFYRDRPYRARTIPEFEAHIQKVKDYLGRGVSRRRSIFMSDANALDAPLELVLGYLEAINRAFPIGVGASARAASAFDSVYSFVDTFSDRHRTPDEYGEIAARGLRRVYVGLETGHDPLRKFLAKPGKTEDAVRTIAAMQAGGLKVGVIVMVGAGGRQFERGHVEDTTEALNSLDLGPGDLIYFSELVEHEDAPYATHARETGVSMLDSEALREQSAELRGRLRWRETRTGPKVAVYDVDEFLY